MSQETYLGSYSSERLSEIIDRYLPKVVLVVRGKDSYSNSGAEQSINTALKNRKTKIIEFYNFEENPKIEDVNKGVILLNNEKVDLIIGIGGGSVIDMSKLIRFFFSYSTNDSFQIYEKQCNTIPLIILPTTAGTGSECTHFAVVYYRKQKYSIAHLDILPDVAIIDSKFTYNIPKYITACTGLDALSQAIEAYWNINANEESDNFSLKALSLLYKNLPKVVNSPSYATRDLISEGSHWAGRAINITKTTAPHALSYPFTSFYGFPHGHAVALTLPQFLEFNYGDAHSKFNGLIKMKDHQHKMDFLYQILKIDNSSTACAQMVKYISSLGLSFKLPENFDPELIKHNINLDRINNNPLRLDNFDVDSIINRIDKQNNISSL